jgi:hypothetical protein
MRSANLRHAVAARAIALTPVFIRPLALHTISQHPEWLMARHTPDAANQ